MRPSSDRRGPRWQSQRGFTLIEVTVALLLAAVVLLLARVASDQLSVAAREIARRTEAADGAANADRLLRQLVRDIEVGTTDSTYFAGDSQSAHFTSWCPVPGGWQERCGVDFNIQDRDGSPRLVASLTTGDTVTFRDRGRPTAIRYLSDARDGGHWLIEIGRGFVPPLGIGVVYRSDNTHADTLFLRLGDRG